MRGIRFFFRPARYVPDFPPGILSGWGKGTESRKPNPEPPPRMGIEKKREIPEWTPGKDRIYKKLSKLKVLKNNF